MKLKIDSGKNFLILFFILGFRKFWIHQTVVKNTKGYPYWISNKSGIRNVDFLKDTKFHILSLKNSQKKVTVYILWSQLCLHIP